MEPTFGPFMGANGVSHSPFAPPSGASFVFGNAQQGMAYIANRLLDD